MCLLGLPRREERPIRSAAKWGFRRCRLDHESTFYDGSFHDVGMMEMPRPAREAPRKDGAPRIRH